MSNKVTVLLLDGVDPPTDDLRQACNLLFKRPEVKTIWLCPIGPFDSPKHIIDMCNIFCQQYRLAESKEMTCCTVAIDKKMGEDQLVEWARINYPAEDFRVASFNPYSKDRKLVYRICFGSCSLSLSENVPINITKSVPNYMVIKERIKSGKDESKKMFHVVWEYIQKHKLYRG